MPTVTHSLAERLILPGSPFELTREPKSGQRIFRHAPRSLQALFQNASRFGSRICMAIDGAQVSFEQIIVEATSLALVLARRHGVCTGTRVAVIAAGSPAWLAAAVGVWWAGGVAIIVDRHVGTEARLAVLDTSGCAIVVTERQCSREMRDCGDRRTHILMRDSRDWTRRGYFEDVEIEAPGDVPSSPPAISNPDEDALIAFTSGSTGIPKGVISTHRAILSGMFNTLLSAALASARDRTLTGRVPTPREPPCSLLLSPFSHVGGYSHLLLMTHLAGKVVPHTGHAAEAIAAIAREKVTVLSGASFQVLAELLRSESISEALRSLSAVALYGSAPAPRPTLEIQSRFPTIRLSTGYGLTETNGSICSTSGAELVERPGTCGPVLPSVEVSIRDGAGRDVPTGRSGDVWIRGPMLMRGYMPTCNRTASPAVHHGWFCTEDMGWLDSDGYLYVSGRRQDVLWSSGVRVSCKHIEWLLCDGGLAKDAAVIAVKRCDHEARLIVAVVPTVNGEPDESLAAWLQRITSLSNSQITVMMLDHIPRTASGKPDRIGLGRLAHLDDPIAEVVRR